MLHARLDNDSSSALHLRSLQAAPPPAAAANAPAMQPLQGRHEPAWHPQLSALAPATAAAPQCSPEGIGAGQLSALAGGQQAQPFDVVLSPCLLSQLVGYASDVLECLALASASAMDTGRPSSVSMARNVE